MEIARPAEPNSLQNFFHFILNCVTIHSQKSPYGIVYNNLPLGSLSCLATNIRHSDSERQNN